MALAGAALGLLAGLVAGLFGLQALLSPVAAQTAMTLVSNAGQGNDDNAGSGVDRSQAFTTSAGATLSSVEINSVDLQGDDVAVSLCTVDGSNHPTATCTALTAPSSFAAGTLVFTAPANTPLVANTTYSLLVASPGGQFLRLGITTSDNEDAGGATGWSIANAFDVESSPNVWTANGARSLRITIKGTIAASTNSAPTVATEIPDQTAMSGTAFSYEVPAATFTDADSDTLTYTATLADDMALPSWLSFDAATRTFSGTPTAAETVSVKVTASDASDSVSDTFDIVVSAAVTGICSRTAEVQTALLAMTGRATCSDVTAADLVAVTSLTVSSYSGAVLDPADFAGLTGLTNLVFDGSPQLTTLPDNAFAGVTALTHLDFSSLVTVTMVAEDAFSGLTALENLNLSDNLITTLDEDTFDGLTALRILDLSYTSLTTLDADIFDGLTALRILALNSNSLTTLDADIFDGLTALEELEQLDGGNDWPTGLWSDGENLWLLENGQGADDAVYAYDRASGERAAERVQRHRSARDRARRLGRGPFDSEELVLWNAGRRMGASHTVGRYGTFRHRGRRMRSPQRSRPPLRGVAAVALRSRARTAAVP